MPLVEHRDINRPNILDPLWRYMDLSKFLALLSRQSIWMANAEILARDDPHEGTISGAMLRHKDWTSFSDMDQNAINWSLANFLPEDEITEETIFQEFMIFMESIRLLTKHSRPSLYVSCWHKAKNESLAMWKVYDPTNSGLAIKTNGLRFQKALEGAEGDIYLGEVRYFDENIGQIDWTNTFRIILSKRDSFAYEQEVRLIKKIYQHPTDYQRFDQSSWNAKELKFDDEGHLPQVQLGFNLDLSLNELIEEIVISPFAPAWQLEVVSSALKAFKFDLPVRQSNLLEPPY